MAAKAGSNPEDPGSNFLAVAISSPASFFFYGDQMRASYYTLVFLSISACGGGGSAPAPIVPTPPPADADPGGFWLGSLTNADQTFEELVAITTSDGRFILVSIDTFGPDTVGQYVGTATIDGSNVIGSGSAYAAPGTTWSDGSAVLDLTLTAVIDERTSMSGSWETSAGDVIDFELDYDADYERASSLTLLEGVWYVYDDVLNPTLTLTVDPGGLFLAQSTLGCQSLGQASIIDAAYNIYGWDVTISGCPIAGNYSGLAAIGDIDTGDPANSQNNAVLVSISNDQRAILLPLER